jgi:putative oxidoreductase
MAVAYFMVHEPRGLWPIMNRGEVVVLYCFSFFFLAAYGAGPYSVDALLGRTKERLRRSS